MFKVGDRVKLKKGGLRTGEIVEISAASILYPIRVEFEKGKYLTFTEDGKHMVGQPDDQAIELLSPLEQLL